MGDRTMVVSPNRGQGSLYNLTFDEVQSHLGNNICKPLNTMNLDELLRNLMSVEEGQLVQNTSSSSSALLFLKNLNLNGTLRKKTVDELWKEIVHKQHVNEMEKEQSTLGETTLEEFLVRAAISSASSDSQVAAERKRRCSDEMMEKAIERRQKRMIKNRESAARSRARKQAYTIELETAVVNLRETNSLIKKRKEVDILLSSISTPMPKYQLRRTSSV
ncbi:abscisic acid-insensitive 5-like protein 3 [Quercus suber]|uniref:Abscisic acid-insensitive 5-like protein 3 n=1 Tax=Quercus suber TaxID=58331 RepID=A0AAW0LU19_QUESU